MHIEAVAAVDAHSSAAKAPAQLQRPPPVKSSSVLVYVLNWLCCVHACGCSPTSGDSDICVLTVCPPLARTGLEAALRARGVLTDEGTHLLNPPCTLQSREGGWEFQSSLSKGPHSNVSIQIVSISVGTPGVESFLKIKTN